jgi:ABC-2 type transport system permease protein
VSDVRNLRLVAGRELREAMRRRTFWVVIAISLLGSTAAMVVPELLDDDTTSYDVVVVDGSATLDEALHAAADSADVVLHLSEAPDRGAAEQALKDEDADAAAIAGDQPEVVVQGDGNDTLIGLVRQALSVDGLATDLHDAGMSDAEVADAMAAQSPDVVRLDTSESGRRAGAFVVSLVLYLLLLMLMIAVANGTAIEKANRISEVLLATVRPGSLLFGKVIGVGLTGILTVAAGALPVVLKFVIGGDLPAGTAGAVLGGAAWFVLGLALYLILAASLGALVERQEETGSVIAPLSMLLVGTYLVAQSAADTPLGTFMAYFPLTSPLIMPSRLALGVASTFEIVMSLVLGVVAVVIVARVGAVVYKRGIVRTGRRLKLREVLRPA